MMKNRTFFIEGSRHPWRDGDIVFCEGQRRPFDGRKHDSRGDSLIVLFREGWKLSLPRHMEDWLLVVRAGSMQL